MKARHTTKALLLAGVAVSLVYGAASAARADEAQAADPFAAAQTIEQGDLDGLRGGNGEISDSYNTTIEETTTSTATNTSTNTIGMMTIDTRGGDGATTGGMGGAVTGGDVNFSGTALQSFGGVFTGAINTAPGGIATALTSMSMTMHP